MRVAVLTSYSDGTPWAAATLPNTLDYCLRHGYSFHAARLTYAEAKLSLLVSDLMNSCDLVWAIDADCLITNHTTRIENVPGLGPHVSVCEEGMPWLAWNRINCGSMVYRSTPQSHAFIVAVRDAEPEWRDNPSYPFISQSWIAAHADRFGDGVTICPPRTFNSVAWTQHGGGTTWEHGDLVYHPCCHPPEARLEILRQKLSEVVR